MNYFIVALSALLVSAFTFTTGFGLGTLLLPVFILFFPVKVAVAATAVVHLLNNFVKVLLVGKHADANIVVRFGVPAALFAILGAWLLNFMGSLPPFVQYQIFGHGFQITPVKLTAGILIGLFAVVELFQKRFQEKAALPPAFIPAGGVVTGLFAGLTGHQGALRAIVLLKAGLHKEAFIATAIMSSILVDVTRLIVYGASFFLEDFQVLLAEGEWRLIVVGVISAIIGSFVGYRFLKKMTLETVHLLVGILLIIYSVVLTAGLI